MKKLICAASKANTRGAGEMCVLLCVCGGVGLSRVKVSAPATVGALRLKKNIHVFWPSKKKIGYALSANRKTFSFMLHKMSEQKKQGSDSVLEVEENLWK